MDPKLLIRSIFSRFRDLNLVTLMQNLHQARVARNDWLTDGSRLCPLAHGLPGGQFVAGVTDDGLEAILGVDDALIRQFLTVWDGAQLSDEMLLTELNCLWRERRADADAVQYLLTAPEEAAVA